MEPAAQTQRQPSVKMLQCNPNCIMCNPCRKKIHSQYRSTDQEPTTVHIRNRMSYLSTELQRQAERRQLNQSEIARQSSISRSFISRVMSGESRDLSDENFAAILTVFAASPLVQAQLVAARCMDAREAARAAGTAGADLVEIRVPDVGKAEHHAIELPQVHLSSEAEKAFAWLRSQCPINPDLEKHLIGYARLTGMK